MMFTKKKRPLADEAMQLLAGRVAARIIKSQATVASILNGWINKYSVKQQKYLLSITGGTFACALIFSLWVPSGLVANPDHTQNFIPMQIGLPSAIQNSPIKDQLTDSLTKNHKSWKQLHH